MYLMGNEIVGILHQIMSDDVLQVSGVIKAKYQMGAKPQGQEKGTGEIIFSHIYLCLRVCVHENIRISLRFPGG